MPSLEDSIGRLRREIRNRDLDLVDDFVEVFRSEIADDNHLLDKPEEKVIEALYTYYEEITERKRRELQEILDEGTAMLDDCLKSLDGEEDEKLRNSLMGLRAAVLDFADSVASIDSDYECKAKPQDDEDDPLEST